MTRGVACVVQERATANDAGRLGAEHPVAPDDLAAAGVDDHELVAEVRQDVQALARLVERQADGPAGYLDLRAPVALQPVVARRFQALRVEHGDLVGAERCHVEILRVEELPVSAALTADCEADREGQAALALCVRRRLAAVREVDVTVQVHRFHAVVAGLSTLIRFSAM